MWTITGVSGLRRVQLSPTELQNHGSCGNRIWRRCGRCDMEGQQRDLNFVRGLSVTHDTRAGADLTFTSVAVAVAR